MPRILVVTDPTQTRIHGVMLDERIATSDLASRHFAAQLIERIGWALADAEGSEGHALGPQHARCTSAASAKLSVGAALS